MHFDVLDNFSTVLGTTMNRLFCMSRPSVKVDKPPSTVVKLLPNQIHPINPSVSALTLRDHTSAELTRLWKRRAVGEYAETRGRTRKIVTGFDIRAA
jgi:hypothetical protein